MVLVFGKGGWTLGICQGSVTIQSFSQNQKPVFWLRMHFLKTFFRNYIFKMKKQKTKNQQQKNRKLLQMHYYSSAYVSTNLRHKLLNKPIICMDFLLCLMCRPYNNPVYSRSLYSKYSSFRKQQDDHHC